jgi:hypothetical protein
MGTRVFRFPVFGSPTTDHRRTDHRFSVFGSPTHRLPTHRFLHPIRRLWAGTSTRPRALAQNRHRVTVLTANRGYDRPEEKYPAHEERDGVPVRRLPLSSFGKASIPVRIFAQLSFLLQCIARTVFARGGRARGRQGSAPKNHETLG